MPSTKLIQQNCHNDWKTAVDWDIKDQIKQTNKQKLEIQKYFNISWIIGQNSK